MNYEEQYTNGHSSRHSGFTFFQGLVFGGLAGATLAILFAPRSGQDTREMIAQKSGELRDRMAEAADETRSQFATFANRTRTQAEMLAEEARNGAAALQERSRDFVAENRERIERTAEAAQRAAKETWNEAS